MRQKQRWYLLALTLFLALALSFFWCIVDNIIVVQRWLYGRRQ